MIQMKNMKKKKKVKDNIYKFKIYDILFFYNLTVISLHLKFKYK